MAVVSAEEKPQREGSIDAHWKRSYKRVWQVITNDRNDGPITVMQGLATIANVGLGKLYSTPNELDYSFAINESAVCTSIDGLQWDVTIEYGPYDPNQFPENPLDAPLRINWTFAQFERIADVDINNKPITNSAGEPFIEPVKVDDSRPCLTIVKNVKNFDPQLASQYKDSINSDTFYGGDPYTWKCGDIQGALQYNPKAADQTAPNPTGFYYEVTYEFHYDPDGWQVKVADNGLRQIDGSGNLVTITDKNGTPVASPAFLDGQGHALDPTATPVILSFDVYKELPFGALNLDPTGAPGQAA